MKKTSLFAALFIMLFCATDFFAQASFETGKIGVQINEYGRIRIHAPAIDATRQMDRISLLVGADSVSVYDYKNDADVETEPYLVASPAMSDHEIYGEFNNAYSGAAPDFLIKMNVYGWNDAAYFIVKFTIVNREAEAKDMVAGLEINPQIDGSYGVEELKFSLTNEIVDIFKTQHVGIKALDRKIKSLNTFEYFAEYTDSDSALWANLNYVGFDSTYLSGGDGLVAIPAYDAVNIAPNDSMIIYFGFSSDVSEEGIISGINEAQAKYQTITSVRNSDNNIPNNFTLNQNYPNPFNPSTQISFSIPQNQNVTLKIFNALGQEISTLINTEIKAGNYKFDFNASNLPSGIYFYNLTTENFTSTKKMMLIK